MKTPEEINAAALGRKQAFDEALGVLESMLMDEEQQELASSAAGEEMCTKYHETRRKTLAEVRQRVAQLAMVDPETSLVFRLLVWLKSEEAQVDFVRDHKTGPRNMGMFQQWLAERIEHGDVP